MSRKITVQFEIRNELILRDTLEQMGIKFTDLGNTINCKFEHYPVSIDCEKGEIDFDEVDKRKVDNLKQTYTVECYRQQAIREGMHLRQETNAKGEVILYLTK